MSHKAFSISSSNLLTANPSSEKMIFKSTSAADTMSLSLTGLVSAVSTTDTASLVGKKEVQTADTFTSLTAANLASAAAGIVRVYGQGSAGAGYVAYSALPANNDTLIIGLTGYTRTYTYKTSLTGAANEIKIAATVALQATNLYEALNAGANAGTDYGTGTTAHADLTATAPTGANVPVTDLLATSRLLVWSFTQTGTAHTMQIPVGGANGTALAQLAAGITQLYNNFTLSTEDLSSNTLPALVAPVTGWIRVGGKRCSLRFRCANVAVAIALKYQTSTDQVNASDGVTSITSLDNNPVATPVTVVPGEGSVEYIRLYFTGNTNTTDSALDARVIYG